MPRIFSSDARNLFGPSLATSAEGEGTAGPSRLATQAEPNAMGPAGRRLSDASSATWEPLGESMVEDLGPRPLHGACAQSEVSEDGRGQFHLDWFNSDAGQSEDEISLVAGRNVRFDRRVSDARQNEDAGLSDADRVELRRLLRIDTSPERVASFFQDSGQASRTLSAHSHPNWPSLSHPESLTSAAASPRGEAADIGAPTPMTPSGSRTRASSVSQISHLKQFENRRVEFLQTQAPQWIPADVKVAAQVAGWSWLGATPQQKVLNQDTEAELGSTFPPPDIDEAAGFLGRIEGLGAVLQRLVMGFGGTYALYAAWQGLYTLEDDAAAIRHLKISLALSDLSLPPEKRGTPRIAQHLRQQELIERRVSYWSNVALVPGSALMGINLLFAPELLGALVPPLIGLSNAAMAPAVICMAIYGIVIAVKAGFDLVHNRRVTVGVTDAPDAGPAVLRANQYMSDRRRSLFVHDWGLVATGVMQAVGAVGMWLTGPAWLGVLLPGTLGLGLFKYSRTLLTGQGYVTQSSRTSELCELPPSDSLKARCAYELGIRLKYLDEDPWQFKGARQPPWAERLLAQMFPLMMPKGATPDVRFTAREQLDAITMVDHSHEDAVRAAQLHDSATAWPRYRASPGLSSDLAAIYRGCLCVGSDGLFSELIQQVVDDPLLPQLRSLRNDGQSWSPTIEDVCDLVQRADLNGARRREVVVERLSQLIVRLHRDNSNAESTKECGLLTQELALLQRSA